MERKESTPPGMRSLLSWACCQKVSTEPQSVHLERGQEHNAKKVFRDE